MKKTILISAAALMFLVAPTFAGKKVPPAGNPISLLCGPDGVGGEQCSVSVTAGTLTPGKAYQFEVVNHCNADIAYLDFQADATGGMAINNTPVEGADCLSPFWVFYLFTVSKNGSQLQLLGSASSQ